MLSVMGVRILWRVMKCVGVVLHVNQILVEVTNAVNHWLNAWDLNVVQFIKVRDELIPIRPDFLTEHLEGCRVQSSSRIKAVLKVRCVSNAPRPVMLRLQISEELAPFEKAHIYEIAVQCYPKLLFPTRHSGCIPTSVVGSVPQAVEAQNSSAAQASTAVHVLFNLRFI